MNKSYILSCLLLIPLVAAGVVKEIVVTGLLDHGDNSEFFGETLPITFEYRLQFDTEAIDEDPLTTLGKYESPGLPVSLRFGSYFYETLNTEVQVWSGDQGFWGFTFGNEDGFESTQNGRFLQVGDYELYGSFISSSQQVTPTDELRWLHDGFHPDESTSSYLYITGVDATFDRVRLQDTTLTGFTVSDVPEPSVTGIIALGASVLLGRRRRA